MAPYTGEARVEDLRENQGYEAYICPDGPYACRWVDVNRGAYVALHEDYVVEVDNNSIILPPNARP